MKSFLLVSKTKCYTFINAVDYDDAYQQAVEIIPELIVENANSLPLSQLPVEIYEEDMRLYEIGIFREINPNDIYSKYVENRRQEENNKYEYDLYKRLHAKYGTPEIDNSTSAVMCGHANECPARPCDCPQRCYCKVHGMCRVKKLRSVCNSSEW